MSDSQQLYAGTRYTTVGALLAAGVVFSPAMLLLATPVGYVSVSVAVACSTLCVALAWANLRWYSRLTIPSIATPRAGAQ
ncbi:MAG: hypothetical protein SFV51_29860 [Bryobacteraceae bacterium]|nr:hypothetical protein [Bryobacteraceae bacterium]